MDSYKIKIHSKAKEDLQQIIEWYDNAKYGLGRRFMKTALKQIDFLKIDSYIYAIRYNDIRCNLVRGFPYMVHFHINETQKQIEILAIISTHQNPKIWVKKTKH